MSDAQKIAQTIDLISESLYNKVNKLIDLYIPGGKNVSGLSGTKYIPTNYKLKIGKGYTVSKSYTRQDITHIIISNCPTTVKEGLDNVNSDLEQQKKYCESNPMLKEWESLLGSTKTQEELIELELKTLSKKFVDKIYELISLYVYRGKNIECLTATSFELSLPNQSVWIYRQYETDVEYLDNVRKVKDSLAHRGEKYIQFLNGKLDGLLETQREYYKKNPRLQELISLNSQM